jgi:putative FmdB family regulatory protein
MPTYEYLCDECGIVFEELLLDPDDIKQYSQQHPCSQCKKLANRVPSVTNFNFKGTPGNSGAHDLDYPVLDKAVGRSADKKWTDFNARKETLDKARREIKSNAITSDGEGKAQALDSQKAQIRERALRAMKESNKSEK